MSAEELELGDVVRLYGEAWSIFAIKDDALLLRNGTCDRTALRSEVEFMLRPSILDEPRKPLGAHLSLRSWSYIINGLERLSDAKKQDDEHDDKPHIDKLLEYLRSEMLR